MPRKPQFSKSDVISATFELVRKSGWPGLSASAVADKLGCSTMPIYSHFKNMEKLQDEVVKMGWQLVKDYESRCFTGDVWIDQAIGYVQFSKKEKRLFMCMFDGRNLTLHREMLQEHWRHLSQLLEGYGAFAGLSEEQCMRIRYSRAMLSHGVASSVSMGYGEILEDDEKIAEYLTSASHALLRGYEQEMQLEEKMNFSLSNNFDALNRSGDSITDSK